MGLGLVAQFWLPALHRIRDVEIVGVVEPDEDRARETMLRYGLTCPAYRRLDEAIDDVSANLVVNLTPPTLHRAVIEAALEHGCQVFSEKPLAASFEDARSLVDLAQRTGLTLAVMQNRRYQPAIRQLRAGLASGAIGDPVFVCADMFLAPRHRNTFLGTMASPLLRDMAIHTFDQARFLTGRTDLRLLSRVQSPPFVVRRRRRRDVHVRADRRNRLLVPRLLGRRRLLDVVRRGLAHQRHARHSLLGQRRRPGV